MDTIVLGGGCFWCTEAVFKRLIGVQSVMPGYTGGIISNPSYREVCMGFSGHNEVIKVDYDESQISLKQLLEVFFTVHDPTTPNRQGNDVGTQYRSGIYYTDEKQRSIAEEYISNDAKDLWEDPIVTELKPLGEFYPAESYHRNYYSRNPKEVYCRIVINPKMKKLRTKFKQLMNDG